MIIKGSAIQKVVSKSVISSPIIEMSSNVLARLLILSSQVSFGVGQITVPIKSFFIFDFSRCLPDLYQIICQSAFFE